TPRASRAAARERERDSATTPAGSDETAVDHEEDARDAAKVAEANMAEDVREQKELIQRLKAERAAKTQDGDEDMEEDEDEDDDEEGGQAGQKRGREDEKEEYRLNIKEPETQERQIATNRRVTGFTPQRKSLAWGALLFAAGVGIASYAAPAALTNFSNFF
ncbi:hypothetical protein EIP91_008176, partial [Steccherinum ochraceum]